MYTLQLTYSKVYMFSIKLYYMILPILELSLIFYILHECVTYNCEIYNHHVIGVMPLSHFLTYITSYHTFLFFIFYFLKLTIYHIRYSGKKW